jgi:hypothetical protein
MAATAWISISFSTPSSDGLQPEGDKKHEETMDDENGGVRGAGNRRPGVGPFTKDDGQTMIGSLLAIDFDSREAAHAWLANEPFTKAGLYASTHDPGLCESMAAKGRISTGSLKPVAGLTHDQTHCDVERPRRDARREGARH